MSVQPDGCKSTAACHLRPVLLGEVEISPERRALAPTFHSHWPCDVRLFRYAPERFYFLRATNPDSEHDSFFRSRQEAIRYSGEVWKTKAEEWRFFRASTR